MAVGRYVTRGWLFVYAPIFRYIAAAMTNATLSPLAAVAALTALVLPAHAQHPTQPHPLLDRTVRVLAPSVFPERRTGRLSVIEDDWIWITTGGITVRVSRTAIETMEVVGITRGGMALRGGLVGAAIGAVSGGLFWGWFCSQQPRHDECVPLFYVVVASSFALPAALFGGIFGAVSGGSWKTVDVSKMSTTLTVEASGRRIGFAVRVSFP